MKKSILKLSLMGMLAAVVAAAPLSLQSQDANGTPAEQTVAKPKRQRAIPFHGKLKALDKDAKTIKVNKLTLQISPTTRLVKAGKPATLDEAVVGEEVGGAYRKADDGTLQATTLRFGPKEGARKPAKKAAKGESEG